MHTWSLFRSWYQTRSLYFIGNSLDHRGRSIVVKAASVACVRISCFFCLGILTYIQCVYILYYSECRPNMEESWMWMRDPANVKPFRQILRASHTRRPSFFQALSTGFGTHRVWCCKDKAGFAIVHSNPVRCKSHLTPKISKLEYILRVSPFAGKVRSVKNSMIQWFWKGKLTLLQEFIICDIFIFSLQCPSGCVSNDIS